MCGLEIIEEQSLEEIIKLLIQIKTNNFGNLVSQKWLNMICQQILIMLDKKLELKMYPILAILKEQLKCFMDLPQN
jgi:hypothetical protein